VKLTETELRDAAREKGIKSAESYGKACRSLAACPITYTRPRELTALVGIGDKTAQMLEVRWAAYCKENGMPLPGEISPGMSPLLERILYSFADQ
jgi:crossover junction endonuclease MUS81